MQTIDKNKNPDQYYWFRFGLIFAQNILNHPFKYGRVLMQIGYEPIPSHYVGELFGKSIFLLPNAIEYALYIKNKAGLFGCFCGLYPRIIGSILSFDLTEEIAELCVKEFKDKSVRNRDVASSSANLAPNSKISIEDYEKLRKSIIWSLLFTTIDCIISHPFHVISIRMMAQFVGEENYYSSLLMSFQEIFKQEGFLGFYIGFVPRLIHAFTFTIFNFFGAYSINKFMPCTNFVKIFFGIVLRRILSDILYPWEIVTVCTIISGTRLKAGNPPLMPHYCSWYDCFTDLHEKKYLKEDHL